ncbi:tail fiber protein [Serratia phage Moabite]|uniref:Tail fiber protein n=1 Tax=Serratia phage Moabite TaxID=2587814 RepID=A0A4Y5TPF0_9CAUD|nr:tail fiber protein [Serratia phage Moabite]QDB71226.1 tail fiber protein [Serratia phage Moabite]
MADNFSGIKISQLDDPNRINDNDIIPFTNDDMGDKQTRKIKLSALRDQLNYDNAFLTVQEGLANTIPGQIFHVYVDDTQLEVYAYLNSNGAAEIVQDAQGNPFKGQTAKALDFIRGELGLTMIGHVSSFARLREIKPPFEGAIVELLGWNEGSTYGGGRFQGNLSTGADDNGIVAAGDGFHWRRINVDEGINPEWFGYVNGSGNDVSTTLKQAIAQAVNLKRPVVFRDGAQMSLAVAGIEIPVGVDLTVANGGRAYFEITHEIETTGQFLVKSKNRISGLVFNYPKQTKDINAKPIVRYGPIFVGAGFYSSFTGINVGNAYYGFKIGGNDEGSASYITMKDINGAPIYRGISLDRVLDIPRISDIHWNYNMYLNSDQDYAPSLKQWIHENGEAFHFGRVDFAEVQRIFAFGYSKGIFLRGERYAGSADSIRFTGCDMDICVNPIYAQNFSGQLVIRNGKFTGNGNNLNGLTAPANGCFNYFQRVSPYARVILDSVTMNNYDRDAIRTGNDTIISNSKIYSYGLDKQQRAAVAIITDSNASLTVDACYFDATGQQNRGITGISTTGQLLITNGTQILNASLEGYRWLTGFALVEEGCRIDGPSRNINTFITNVRRTMYTDNLPTAGGGWIRGDKAMLTNPGIGTQATQGTYTILGWIRITASNAEGTNHVLGVDWLEIRSQIEPVPKFSSAGSARPAVTAIGYYFFDTTLGKPIYLKSANPAVWVDGNGNPV